MLHFGERDTRIDFLYTGQLREFLVHETLVALDVFRDDAQQEVDVTEDNVAVEHLRVLPDRFRKIGDVGAAVRGQLDLCEHHRR